MATIDSSDNNLEIRQENEASVLKSLFGNYCYDLRETEDAQQQQQTKKGKKQQQQQKECDERKLPVLRITLFPSSSQSQCGNENYVQIDLKIEFTPEYPNKIPKLTLENEKGLSIYLKKDLLDRIIKKAKSLIGKEMIYEICLEIQDFLYNNNKPPPKSFHEQMLDNKKNLVIDDDDDDELLFQYETDRNKYEEEHIEEIHEAVLTKRELLRAEMKQKRKIERRERLSSSTNSPSSHPKSGNSESDGREDDVISQITFKPFIIEFNEPSWNKCKINCIKLVKQLKQYNFKIYRGIDINSNDMYLVYEWIFILEKNRIYESKKFDLCLSEFKKVEDELRKLIKINNPLISRYLAYKSYKQSDKPYFIVQLCVSYIEGNTLEIFLNKKTTLNYSNLQLYTHELLQILDFLHSNHVTHRDLKASCVYIDNNGSLKLIDYSIVKRINNLYDLVVNNAQNTLITNNRTDVHQLGIMLLSLAIGETIHDYFPKLPNYLYSDFRNFVSRCIYEQADVKTLLLHPFMTKPIDDKIANMALPKIGVISHIGNTTAATAAAGDYLREAANSIHNSIYNANAIITAATANDKIPFMSIDELCKPDVSIHDEDDDKDILEPFTDFPIQSRLNKEFNVLGKVGSGAFGEVLKVQNKIDMCMYAIKRIRLNPNSNQSNKQITREIKLLSRLNHENVVRYYATWFETHETEIDDSENTDSTFQTTTNTTATPTSNKVIAAEQPIANQQKQKQQLNSTKNTNNNKSIAKSSSFSNLLLKQTNMNFFTTNSDDDDFSDDNDDDDFSSVDKNKVTTVTLPSSTSSSSSSSNSSSSSSSDSDATDSLLTDSDSEDLNAKKFKNIKAVNKNKVKFVLSPNEKKKQNNGGSKFFKIKDEPSDSIVFAAEDKNETSNDNKNDMDKVDTSDDKADKMATNKQHRVYVYIQMEYCKGRTLKDLIDKELYKTVDRVWRLFREILQGLDHIHELGMIHRDLKPRNVLIDAQGHAKIGDFGLATSKYFTAQPNQQNIKNDGLVNTIQNTADSNHYDSISLSGNVGTALYVAPELLTPSGINKYLYTQKVDIYSLGIMFYEMCFPFLTGMERVSVIGGLRKQQFKYPEDFDKKAYSNQIFLIEGMLEHDPDKRPSAKDLLHSDKVPRKADEIALDQLLKESLLTRNTNNYLKIMKSVFEQKVSLKEDVPYDDHNIKAPTLKYLHIREYVQNTLTRLFQKNGAFMITYPLLIPSNEICDDYNNSFQVVDTSGLLLTLPYNHRLHFARYIARSGLTDIKRFHIGNVYQVYSEKFRVIGNHPRENTEASFDIVTSTNADFLPEIEILWLLNDIISSFHELADHEFKLVINHSSLLNSIILYAGIRQDDIETQKNIYSLLATYNKLFKANYNDAIKESNKEPNKEPNKVSIKEARSTWLKEKLKELKFNEAIVNRLVNFLIKHGTVEKVLTEIKNLTKSETHLARLAKQAINQLKFITQCLSLFDLKYEVSVSTSFVLPLIANPFEYNGLLFALYRRKKKKSEYEILASGGRYDRLVNYFCFKKEQRKQHAIGVSIDFEKLVAIIHEKASKQQTTSQQTAPQTQQQSNVSSAAPYSQLLAASPINNFYKNQIAIFSYGLNIMPSQGSTPSTSILKATNEQQQLQTLNQIDIKNRLSLFKYIYYLFKLTTICTHLIHEKFIDVAEMDNYCKRNSILNYIYINNSEQQVIQQISKIFQKYQPNKSTSTNLNSNSISTNQSNNDDDFNLNNIEFYVRTLNNSKTNLKFLEKKYKLNDFLFNINKLSADTCTPLTSISTLINTNLSLTQPVNQTNSSNALNTLNNLTTAQLIIQYLDSVMTLGSTPQSIIYQQQQIQQSQTSITQQTQNLLAQLNITVLVEPNSRSSSSSSGISSSMGSTNSANINNLTSSNSSLNNLNLNARNQNVNLKKIESNLITRLTHVFQLFSTRTRIELIAIEIADSVLQQLGNTIRLDCDEQQFNMCWKEFLVKLNPRYRKQIANFRFEEILRDLRYKGRSKVFIIYSLRSEAFKIFVVP